MSKKSFTLLDTRCGYKYEDYVEYCEVNEITPEPEGSDDYYDWVSYERNLYIDTFFTNLRYARFNEEPVIITGSLGLWNGSNGEWKYNNPALMKAIKKCMNGMDDVLVEYINGEIVIHGYHHDGTNILTINKLTPKGKVTAYNAIKNGKVIEPKPYMFGKFTEEDL